MNSKLKDVFTEVYKTCPQDEGALCEIISSILNNENIYNLNVETNKLLGFSHENILIDGDFGIGKTTMVEEVSKCLNIPFYKFDYPKVGSDVSWDLLVGNFRDIFTMMYKKNNNPKLHGVIVIDCLEKVLDYDVLSLLEGIIGFKDFRIYDDNLNDNVIVDISNITFIGEINRDRAINHVDIPNFNISFSKDLDINEEDSDFEKMKKLQLKTSLFEIAKNQKIYEKIVFIENSSSMWHLFPKHVNFKQLDVESIKIILRDSYLSKYKLLASKLDSDDYLKFFDNNLLDKLSLNLLDDYNKLYSISTYFNEILKVKIENGAIDMLSLNEKQKKKEK